MIKSLEEFQVDGIDLTFRFKKIKPTKLLALSTILGNKKIITNEEVYDLILENTEAKIEGTWTSIKERDLFFPPVLETRLDVLQNIVIKFIQDYLSPVFTKPGE